METNPIVNDQTMDAFRINSRAWALIKARLDSLRVERCTLQELANMVGVKDRATISRWLNDEGGGERTTFREMLQYLHGLNIPLETVFEELFRDPASSGSVYLEKVIQEPAPRGGIKRTGELDTRFAFDRAFVDAHGGRGPLVLMDVCGDDMEPTLRRGDTVMVNQSDQAVSIGDITVVRIEDEIAIKRIHKEPGKLIMVSDNTRYDRISVDLHTKSGGFDVVGKVCWVSRFL
ncbi:MAG: S24 family peptidase [Desulfovibrionaceae bacterium]